jgi:hypothetical protein
MVDAVYAEIPAAAGSTWADVLRSFAHGIRDAALRHEWFADLLGSRPQLGPATLAYTEGPWPDYGQPGSATSTRRWARSKYWTSI